MCIVSARLTIAEGCRLGTQIEAMKVDPNSQALSNIRQERVVPEPPSLVETNQSNRKTYVKAMFQPLTLGTIGRRTQRSLQLGRPLPTRVLRHRAGRVGSAEMNLGLSLPGQAVDLGDAAVYDTQDLAVRGYDGKVVGAFGYRKLTTLEHIRSFLSALTALAILVRLHASPWAVALSSLRQFRLALGFTAVKACIMGGIYAGWLVVSGLLLLQFFQGLLLATVAKPRLLKPEEILPSMWSTIQRLGQRIDLHLLRWSGAGRAPAVATTPASDAPIMALCCHGFGASALSWEDLLPGLPEALAPCHSVLCPDQVGFGLTERPPLSLGRHEEFGVGVPTAGTNAEKAIASLRQDELYRLAGNAVLGSALLEAEFGANSSARQELVVIGHSMGAITASAVAVEQAHRRPNSSVTLILESPAFFFRTLSNNTPEEPNGSGRCMSCGNRTLGQAKLLSLRALRAFVRVLLQLPGFTYARSFWERGLSRVYNRGSMTKAHFAKQVLRYRWPSMSRDWALGLANFITARGLWLQEDREVLRRLIETVNEGKVRVLIISGAEDWVVPVINTRRLRKILKCPLVLMKGLGHLAHEENPEGFVEVVGGFVRRGELPPDAEMGE